MQIPHLNSELGVSGLPAQAVLLLRHKFSAKEALNTPYARVFESREK